MPNAPATPPGLAISIFEHARDTEGDSLEVTWDALVEALTTHDIRETKDGRAWSPATYNGPRDDAHVTAITAAVFDVDHIAQADFEALAARLDASGHAFVIHSTHSHNPPNNQSYRLAFPLTRPVNPAEWPAVRQAIIAALDLPADPKTGNPSRIYYEPSARPGAPTLAHAEPGRPIDVDALAPAPAAAPKTPGVILDVVDMDAIRSRLRAIAKPESRALVARILKGEPLAPNGDRDNTVNRAASIIATATSAPPEVAEALVRTSIAGMPLEPEGFDAWMGKFRYCYARALERKAQNDAHRERLNAAVRAALGHGPPVETRPGDLPLPEADQLWLHSLATRTDKEGNKHVLSTAANVSRILEHSPEWAGHILYNALTRDVEITGGPCEDVTPATLHTAAANWLAWSEFKVNVPSHIVAEQILEIARRHTYDPLTQSLDALQWDGVPRLDTMLEVYFFAETKGPDGEDNTPYVRAVSAAFLISLVARAYLPGCKVDNMLILEGDQGIGKSTALKILGGAFFCDEQITIGDKDSLMVIGQAWLVELAELETLRVSEAEARKAFLSRPTDRYRAPYAKVTEDHPRRCVFVGTTNHDDYLSDTSGNRRFWPIRCRSAIDLEGLARNRDQIVAEAVHRFKAGEVWHLRGDSAQAAAREAEKRVAGTAVWGEAILTWWQRMSEEKRPAFVSTRTVALEALGLSDQQTTRGAEMSIGRSMKALGFVRARRRVGGVLTWVYEPSEILKRLPRVIGPASLAALAPPSKKDGSDGP